MKRISETKGKCILTVGLVRMDMQPGKSERTVIDMNTIEHMRVMLTPEESEAWYRMVRTIVKAQVDEKNKQWKG